MKQKLGFTLSAIATLLCSQSVMAQAADTGFFASVDTTLAHDDNIYRVTDDLAKSDSYVSVAPELSVVGGLGKQRFSVSYKGDYAKFSSESDADYADHDLRARVDLEHTLRFGSKFEAGYQKEHEEPGAINRIQLDATEYNKFNQSYFLAGVSYGQETSMGRVAINYIRTDKDYTNNNLDYLDFTSDRFFGRFTYRVAPKTRLYVETSFATFDYTPGQFFELDNSLNVYRAGVTWDFTNKLTGDINIGYQNRDYDLSTIRDIDGIAYDGEVTWSINSYTILAVSASRESIDSSLEEAGGFLRTSYNASIKHSLTELLSLTFDAGTAKDELVFSSDRQDNRYAYELGIEYDLSRLITLGANYRYEERDSTNDFADFKSNTIGLTVTVSLEN